MSPYLKAHKIYHQDTTGDLYTWGELLDIHLQAGAVVSTASSFVLARPVSDRALLSQCLDLSHTQPDSSTWFVILAAGHLSALLLLASQHKIETLLYQRHNSPKLRRISLSSLLAKASSSKILNS